MRYLAYKPKLVMRQGEWCIQGTVAGITFWTAFAQTWQQAFDEWLFRYDIYEWMRRHKS